MRIRLDRDNYKCRNRRVRYYWSNPVSSILMVRSSDFGGLDQDPNKIFHRPLVTRMDSRRNEF